MNTNDVIGYNDLDYGPEIDDGDDDDFKDNGQI